MYQRRGSVEGDITRAIIGFVRKATTPQMRTRLVEIAVKLLPSMRRVLRDRRILRQRRRMLNLGFLEKGKVDLINWALSSDDLHMRRLAAWELSALYLDEPALANPREALRFLDIAVSGETRVDVLRRAEVMRIEAEARSDDLAGARRSLAAELARGQHPDVLLAAANLEEDLAGKTRCINQALNCFGLTPIAFDANPAGSPFDRLRAVTPNVNALPAKSKQPLISVIMPTYNSERVIETAIQSILAQSWTEFELLVVDDRSTDDTAAIVEHFRAQDCRVQLLRTSENSGPYVARNLALTAARGEFVTCHDADDWSHPSKLEIQARRLMANPKVIANLSEQVRASSGMVFFRKGSLGLYIFKNFSSLLFRRKEVVDRIGFWDSVRFGADGEFLRRAKIIFGNRSVEAVKTGPLSFTRHSGDSLTGSGYFGYNGYFFGARQEYFDSSQGFHKSSANLKYEFPMAERPFSVPEPMRPRRTARAGAEDRRHFDIVLASDFRLDGGSTLSSIEEVKAQAAAGLKTGLMQLSRYDFDPMRRINSKVRDLLEEGKVEQIVYGEKISCGLLLVRYPPVLQEMQRFAPDVEAQEVRVIVNQPPMSDYGANAVVRYDIPRCQENLERLFAKRGIWHPIGPAVRDVLHAHHNDDLSSIALSDEDWVNIIDVDAWTRPKRPLGNKRPRIGRHARDHQMKWPDDKHALLLCYPESDRYEVSILGGAEYAKSLIGHIPANWNVFPFDSITPREYLWQLDVFVYFTNTQWVESFGRVIIEAMAAGVPVIVPHVYEPLFKHAAIYATPAAVRSEIDKLLESPEYYQRQVEAALEYVRNNFGYQMHVKRVAPYIRTA